MKVLMLEASDNSCCRLRHGREIKVMTAPLLCPWKKQKLTHISVSDISYFDIW